MLRTFKIGGVHPPENKLTANKKTERMPLPRQVIIPLSQHIGVPSVPVVAKGDPVKVGTMIAKAGGFVSARIHSPVSGTVSKIDHATDVSGYKRTAIIIDVEGDVWEETIDRTETLVKTCSLSSKEIIEKITEAGIVGMGGATFPTQVKLLPPPGMKAEILLINGAECEPYLTSDHALMLEKAEEILVGTQLLMRAIGVDNAVIGIENNKKDAVQSLTSLAKKYSGIRVFPLKVRYPQGGEKQLIDAVVKRQVPGGSLPVAVGVIVHNVGTAYAVYEAVQKNKPLFERIVTVTGKRLTNPCNLWVRLGTPARELIEYAGGLPEDTGKIISGGPMMGKALVDTDVPVTKGSSGILLLSSGDTKRKEMRDCIRCSQCVQVCPMGLVPSFLMSVTEFEEWGKAEQFDIMDCIECGACSYVCPSNRPLLDYIRMGKAKVSGIIRARKE